MTEQEDEKSKLSLSEEPGQTPASSEELPEIDDRYEVLDKIGEGGMGSVYKVHDRVLEKVFAIKLVKPDLLNDNVSMKRFEKEAQSAVGLTHPNLVSVYGHRFTSQGQPYLLMDYLEGENLSQFIVRNGRPSYDSSLEIFLQLSDALQHAHAKGIVHRDLKPSNVLIVESQSGDRNVQVLDFGISKVLRSTATTQGLTKEQQVFGSPHYMSPEQCQGDELDARSDIYSLGCMMFEMLTGLPPYPADNPIQTLMKHINSDPPVFDPAAGVPANLQAIVLRCLEKHASDRYQSMEELRHDLERHKLGRAPKAARKRRLKINRKHAVIACGALAFFGFGAMAASMLAWRSDTTSDTIPANNAPATANAPASSVGLDNLLTWNLPSANVNDPESLIRRLAAADEQSSSRYLYRTLPRTRISSEQRRLRREAVKVLAQQTQMRLIGMGKSVIPVVLKYLPSERREVSRMCYRIIEQMGTQAVVPFVDHAINHGVNRNEYYMANTLAKMGQPALEELSRRLSSSTNQNRYRILTLLATTSMRVGTLDTSMTPTLENIANKDSKAVNRSLAIILLAGLADRNMSARNTVINLANTDSSSEVRVAAISGLGAIASAESSAAAGDTMKVLAKVASSDPDSYLRFAATANLGMLGTRAASFKPALEKLSRDRNAAVSMAARVGALLASGKVRKPSREEREIRDTDRFLGELNASASDQELEEKLVIFDKTLRYMRSKSFPTHPDYSGFVLPALMNGINTADTEDRNARYRFEILSKLGHYAKPGLATLYIGSARSGNSSVRHSAWNYFKRVLGSS